MIVHLDNWNVAPINSVNCVIFTKDGFLISFCRNCQTGQGPKSVFKTAILQFLQDHSVQRLTLCVLNFQYFEEANNGELFSCSFELVELTFLNCLKL